MPVWHEATRELRRRDEIQVVGVIQEQHPDRCKLFAQWKRFDWPILVDSLNLLEVPVVPIVLMIDKEGIVRAVLRDPHQDLLKLTEEWPPEAGETGRPIIEASDAVRAPIKGARDLVYFQEPPQWSRAIASMEQALLASNAEGRLHFALGALYRGRYDSAERQPRDFQNAVDHWQAALESDPNQYIWRRRLQQYGPRSDKPYPFYDWVGEARGEIQARGQIPVPLAAEPTKAELAAPAKELGRDAEEQAKSPDPDGRITRDNRLINAEVTVIPPRVRPGNTSRVQIVLRPSKGSDVHWSNEAGPTQVFVDLSNGWAASDRLLVVAPPDREASDEPRSVEFELKAPSTGVAGPATIPIAAFYGVCEGSTGACLYRRKDLAVSLDVRPEQGNAKPSTEASPPCFRRFDRSRGNSVLATRRQRITYWRSGPPTGANEYQISTR